MVELIQVGEHSIDEKTFDLALDEYENLRGSEEHGEEYKWDIFEELNEWVESNGITEDNVSEFIDLLQDKNPKEGMLVHWTHLDNLKEYAEENPGVLVELFDNLYDDTAPLEERVKNFRNSITVGTDCIGYLLAAYDKEEYAPFKQNNFQKFLDYFIDGDVISLDSLSVPEKYSLFTVFCNELGEEVSDRIDLEQSALTGQDFIYSTTTYSIKDNIKLRFLYDYASQLNSLKEQPHEILQKITELPDDFLDERLSYYEDRQDKPIGEIRYRVLSELLSGEEPDIEQIKEDVDSKHEKDTLHSWKDFTILSQVYIDYHKRRFERYLDDISETVQTQMEEESEGDLDYHTVSFQGSSNFPTDRSWLVVYPSNKEDHKEAYQLFIGIDSEGIEYGIHSGSSLTHDKIDSNRIQNPEEAKMEEVLDYFRDNLDRFYRLNNEATKREVEVDEDTKPDEYERLKSQINKVSQLVFYGPPGTGKTYTAKKFAEYWVSQEENSDLSKQVRTVTFHPSYSYEDFVEGLEVKGDGNSVSYEIEPGVFREICEDARRDYEKAETDAEAPKYILIIDEINRGNLPKILGETITLLEEDKRIGGDNHTEVRLSHSGKKFSIPPNLKIIGTMNTADRSIALVDAAIRRRFRFLHFPPDYSQLRSDFNFEGEEDVRETVREDNDQLKVMQGLSILALEEINKRIIRSGSLGKGKQLGHSYLLNKSKVSSINDCWKYEILPLLEEYYFEQFDRMRQEIFDSDDIPIIDWEREEIKDFNADELEESLRKFVDVE